MVRGVLATFAQPRAVAREAVRLGRETVRIARGTDEIAPQQRDKRFADPAWSLHPGYRRLAQSYVAVTGALDRLVDDYAAGGADWRGGGPGKVVLQPVTHAPAPAHTPVGNPAAPQRALATRGP